MRWFRKQLRIPTFATTFSQTEKWAEKSRHLLKPKNGQEKIVRVHTWKLSACYQDCSWNVPWHARGGLANKKKIFLQHFFLLSRGAFLVRTTPKGRNREARHETHARTRNGPKISQVRDATINALNAFNESFEGLPGLKNQIWKHFFFVVFHGDSEFHIFKSIWGEKISKKCVHWLSWRFFVLFWENMAFICELAI